MPPLNTKLFKSGMGILSHFIMLSCKSVEKQCSQNEIYEILTFLKHKKVYSSSLVKKTNISFKLKTLGYKL